MWHLTLIEIVKTTLESQPIINYHCTMDLYMNLLNKSKVNVSNLLLKEHEIPFTSMEPPFVLMVGTMLQNIQCQTWCLIVVMGMYF